MQSWAEEKRVATGRADYGAASGTELKGEKEKEKAMSGSKDVRCSVAKGKRSGNSQACSRRRVCAKVACPSPGPPG